jgi:hypothetical protein
VVDDESGIPWPSSVEDSDFSTFLDKLGEMFATLPSVADATIDLDEDQIRKDVRFLEAFEDVLVAIRQTETWSARLQVAGTVGFEEFPKFADLVSVAEHVENPHFKPGFQLEETCQGL